MEIELTRGKKAIVDAEDYERIMSMGKWHFDRYAKRVTDKTIYMHRVILEAPEDLVVDHINGNKLDNRKSNLRLCTRADNTRYTSSRGGYSKYVGVSYDKSRHKWKATVCHNYKKIQVRFDTELEAAHYRDKLVKQLRGEFAKLNFG